MKKLLNKLARDYVKTCQWEEFLYEDKSGMSAEKQRERPSDIPSNLELAFKAGWGACFEVMGDAASATTPTAEEWSEALRKKWESLPKAADRDPDYGYYKVGFYDGSKWMQNRGAEPEIKTLEDNVARTVHAAYTALLEMSAWLGIPERKRMKQIDYLMENVKYCAGLEKGDWEK